MFGQGKKPMKLLILGVAGLTWRELVNLALAQGHAVTAFVRKPEGFWVEHDNLKVVRQRPTLYRRKHSLANSANTKRKCLARCYSGYIINTTLETAS
jgi:hypothetical protein